MKSKSILIALVGLIILLLTIIRSPAPIYPGMGGGGIGAGNGIFANQIFVDGVSGSDITGNGTITAPYLTITNAQAVDITSYNNLYTIVVERGIFDYKNQDTVHLTNNSSMYFYSGVVITNTSFGVYNCTNAVMSVSGALSLYSSALSISGSSNVTINIGSPNAPLQQISGGGLLISDNTTINGDCQNISVSIFVNSFSAGLMFHTRQFTNSAFHVTAYYPSTVLSFASYQSGNLATYPYTNDETLEITCPQITSTGSATSTWQSLYCKLILDPMVFICSTYPSVSQTNILLVARDVEFTTWPTNLLLNSPPNLFTNTFWP